MIERESPRRGRVPVRTIIAAFVMLTGVVLMGYGYFQKEHVFFYIGAALMVGGVMMEAILAVVPASRERWKGRIPKV
jgi:drug/metabolite transporter (DMT)-like permease